MPKIVDKTKKAAEIAEAALGVFREQGYHHTRMADVARAAGIGKGTVYEYFDDKADILRVSFDSYFDAFRRGAFDAIREVSSPAGRLTALVRFALAHVAEWEQHCSVYVDYFSLERTGKQGPFSLASFYEEFGSVLKTDIEQGQQAGEIRSDLDVEATADLLLSIYDGVVLHGIFNGQGQSSQALATVALEILTHGLLQAAPAG